MIKTGKPWEQVKKTNRKWQNHLKSTGFDAFMYSRLMMYSLSGPETDSTFNFKVQSDEENELAKYWFNWMEEFPYEIYLEITNHCNLKCSMCTNEKLERDRGFMSDDLFKKIIDEVSIKRPVSYFHMYGIGDPLMDPDIMKKMEYSWKEKQLSQVFGTNGKALLKNDNYKVLVDMEIPIMTIDVDGFSKDTYEKIRVGGNFDKIIKTVETVYDYIRSTGSKTRLELIYLSVPDFNEHEVVSFVNWCEENEYEYKITSLHTWAENRSELSTSERNPARTSPCRGLWGGLMIYWNGDVSTCFQDADGFEIFGNVKEQSIQEIWQTSLRQRRQEHVKGTFRNLCHGCQSFLNSGLPKCNSIVYPEILR